MATDKKVKELTVRLRGRHLQRIRDVHLSNNPMCVKCGRVATQVDHILALTNGGADVEANRQGLCVECHKAKTRRDMGWREKPSIGLDGWPIDES